MLPDFNTLQEFQREYVMKQIKFFIPSFIPALAFIALSLSLSTTAAPANDVEKITESVMNYFDGIGEASKQRLDKAFNLKAQMITPSQNKQGESELKVWEIVPTIKHWSDGKPAKKERIGKILNMHIMDSRLASVSFDSNDEYYDLLTLAKMDGEWKIINKAYIDKHK